jgi:hypothetical protein
MVNQVSTCMHLGRKPNFCTTSVLFSHAVKFQLSNQNTRQRRSSTVSNFPLTTYYLVGSCNQIPLFPAVSYFPAELMRRLLQLIATVWLQDSSFPSQLSDAEAIYQMKIPKCNTIRTSTVISVLHNFENEAIITIYKKAYTCSSQTFNTPC